METAHERVATKGVGACGKNVVGQALRLPEIRQAERLPYNHIAA